MHTITERPLTDIEQTVLDTVRKNPNLTAEDYANILGQTKDVYSAIAYLIFARYLCCDERNSALSEG